MEAEKQDDVDDLAVDRREVGLLGNQLVLRVGGGEGALEVTDEWKPNVFSTTPRVDLALVGHCTHEIAS